MICRRLLLLIALMCATAHAVSTPRPTKSEYLLSTGASITFAPDRGAFYLMSFSVVKATPNPIFVTVQYQNPENQAAPLSDEVSIKPGDTEVKLQSPSFRVVMNRRRYAVELSLYADSQHQQLLGKHRQDVLFSVPSELAAVIVQRFNVSIQ